MRDMERKIILPHGCINMTCSLDRRQYVTLCVGHAALGEWYPDCRLCNSLWLAGLHRWAHDGFIQT